MKKRILAILLASVMALALSACGNDNDNPNTFEGGILNVASLQPFTGIFNLAFAAEMPDAEIAYWMTEPLLLLGDDLQYNQEGAATYTYDIDAKTVTLTMKPGVKWHDGQPVTMEDLVFAYEVLADPGYDGYFFAETSMQIKGILDYNAGDADSISGLVLSEDKNTLTMFFNEFMPSTLEGNLWVFPLPKHQLGGIAVPDMAADPRSRAQVLGFGPFKIKNVTSGELVELVRFDDYWQGKPKLDGVTITVVNPDMLPSSMERGLYDLSLFPAEAYDDHMEPVNYRYSSVPDQWYQYTGFHLGRYDFETGENIPDPNGKMSNLNLRRAIGYAVDLKSICDDFFNGLRGLNPTPLSPNFSAYQNPNVNGYPYDPEKAKTLLDEAGYIDIDGDGFREAPDSSPLVINWAVPNSIPETVTQFKIQCWHDVGLNVQLLNGNLIDNSSFFGMLFEDDPDIDMFEAGWFLEESPKLAGTWNRYAMVNFTRFASAEMDALLDALDSPQAWDKDYRIKAYHDFQEYFFEQSPAIPTVWRTNLYAVNNRVRNVTLKPVYRACDKYLIELTQDTPFVK